MAKIVYVFWYVDSTFSKLNTSLYIHFSRCKIVLYSLKCMKLIFLNVSPWRDKYFLMYILRFLSLHFVSKNIMCGVEATIHSIYALETCVINRTTIVFQFDTIVHSFLTYISFQEVSKKISFKFLRL